MLGAKYTPLRPQFQNQEYFVKEKIENILITTGGSDTYDLCQTLATHFLSKENNWSYSWKTKEGDAKWTIIERNTPSKYTMTVEKRDTSFVLTNTYIPENSSKDPQTGDTSNIMLYVILMIVSGSILIIIGVMGKRDVHEKTK